MKLWWLVFVTYFGLLAFAVVTAHGSRLPTASERVGIERGVNSYLKTATQVKNVQFSHFAVSTVSRHFARVSLRADVGYAVAALVQPAVGLSWGSRWQVYDLGSAEVGCFGPPDVFYPASVKSPDFLYNRVFRDLRAPRLGFFCP